MFNYIKYLLVILIFLSSLSSCSNKTTSPSNNQTESSPSSPDNVPENIVKNYSVKADESEANIEAKMQEYFAEYGYYSIFLEDTKENIDKNNTISKINTIIAKDTYTKDGVYLDLSKTTMTDIADNAFEDNKNLFGIKLPETITSIGENAFVDCSSLKTINFPSSLTSIGEYAFQSCIKLETADLSQTKIIEIKGNSFHSCSSLKNIVLSQSILAIQANAFHSCTSLEEVALPDNFIGIASSAFAECKALKKVTLNEKITQISGMAFYNCTSLEKISLPSSIKTIRQYAFTGCTSLKQIEYLGTTPSSVAADAAAFSAYSTAGAAPLESLYLPNVANAPSDGSWNNFLNYDWSKKTINYAQSMPK
ncbi:leucine-rich repeat domain-containing protein [uncultured Brachyspira sp.]|uniref:leucine-rich repeat domain-containing protein n=1 Tax=uncultured Brachyspira sp. TaxID=221953 RepID=UPI002613CFD7|nr:leucine-rich repeat domain-containing protein [uncultured Brachyspira sp.]